MRKKSIIAITVLIGLSVVVSMGNYYEVFDELATFVNANTGSAVLLERPNVKKDSFQMNDAAGSPDPSEDKIPLHVTYLFLFQRLAAFNDKANAAELKGEDGSSYRTLYTRLASLSDDQNATLMRVGVDCMEELKVKDALASQIATRLRAEHQFNSAAGKAPTPPPPSPELIELQKLREEVILRHRETKAFRAILFQDKLLNLTFQSDLPRLQVPIQFIG